MKLQTSVQCILVSIFCLGLLLLSTGTYEATSSTAANVVSHLERFWPTSFQFGNVQKAFLPDPAPWEAYRGRAPQMTACAHPNENCAPPSEDCVSKKLTGSGLLECKSRPKLVFATGIFIIFVDWYRIWCHIWDEDLFFWDHLFLAGKTA